MSLGPRSGDEVLPSAKAPTEASGCSMHLFTVKMAVGR